MSKEMSLDEMLATTKIKVVAFTNKPRCFACGENSDAGFVALWRRFYHGVHYSKVDLAFCDGAKGAVDIKQGVHMITGQPLNVEIQYDCAGVAERHIHVHCRACHAKWMMACSRDL